LDEAQCEVELRADVCRFVTSRANAIRLLASIFGLAPENRPFNWSAAE
jgi:hypothetical protein